MSMRVIPVTTCYLLWAPWLQHNIRHVHMNVLTHVLLMLHKLRFIKLGRTLSRNEDSSGQLWFKFHSSAGKKYWIRAT